MKALVTGAAGFLGRHVAQRLVEDGFDVTGFDQVPIPLDIRSISGDLLDQSMVTAAIAGQDVVCHIGAIGDVYLAASHPSLAAAVNVTGSANVGNAAHAAGARVVYASTWEVYGNPEFEPIDETHPCAPDHPYSITKLAGERMLLAADHLQGVPTLALRLGTAFGTGLRPNSVFRLFIDRARRGEPITIMGDGSQSRQFTHATDIARAFSMAARSDLRGIVLNTVAPEPISIKQLAEAVIAHLPTDLIFAPARPGDVAPAVVSSEKIGERLGWEPHVSFEDGVEELIAEQD
jgi:UDP-glucose 4-epimerase